MAARRLTALALAAALIGAPPAAAGAMKAEVTTTADGLRVLSLSGTITYEDRERVPAIIRRGGYDEVWLNSGGGNAFAGFAIGRALRQAGAVARIPAGSRCASACVYVFAGAPVRFADTAYTIGVHPASRSSADAYRRRVADNISQRGDQATREVIMDNERLGSVLGAGQARYFLEMGVSAKLVEHLSEVRFDCIRYLSANGLKYFNLVNTAGPPPPRYRPTDSRDIELGAGGGCPPR